jgi:vacuolar protein-sorting-associated protein 4
MSELRDKAIAFVKQAVEADNAQNYEQAFGLYMHALDFFEAHLKYEKNPRAKEAITKKACGFKFKLSLDDLRVTL